MVELHLSENLCGVGLALLQKTTFIIIFFSLEKWREQCQVTESYHDHPVYCSISEN